MFSVYIVQNSAWWGAYKRFL